MRLFSADGARAQDTFQRDQSQDFVTQICAPDRSVNIANALQMGAAPPIALAVEATTIAVPWACIFLGGSRKFMF
jgi:hypothetical protein